MAPHPVEQVVLQEESAASRRLLLTIAAGILGLLASFLDIPILPEVTLVFSGIFYLTIAIAYGPAYGLLAAAIASLGPVVEYRMIHPVLVAMLEAAVIGRLTRRRICPSSAAAIFWCVLGLPLLVVFVLWFGGLPAMTGWAIILKRVVNGFLNVVIADFLLSLRPVTRFLDGKESRNRAHSLRQLISTGLLMVTLISLVSLSVAFGRFFAGHEEQESVADVRDSGVTIRDQVDEYIRKHRNAVESLARLVNADRDFSPRVLSRLLQRQHGIYPGFVTMMVADRMGKVLATSPFRPGNAAGSVRDRAYMFTPAWSGRSFTSDVFLGRDLGHDPIVAISAPVYASNGILAGIVEGSLKLRAFEQFGSIHGTTDGIDVAIIDQRSRVIYATPRLSLHELDSIEGTQLLAVASRAPQLPLLDWRNSSGRPAWIANTVFSKSTDWRVIVRSSLEPIHHQLQFFYLRTLIWLLAAVAVACALAGQIARRITSPLYELEAALRNFTVEEPSPKLFAGSQDVPPELMRIRRHFVGLTIRLADTYNAMRGALQEKDSLNAELHKLLVELSDATARAEAANQAKSLFLASMSHEIRTPLNAIVGVSDLLASGSLPDEERSLIETVQTSSRGLLTLINDILDFSKIESGKLELEQISFDIRDVVESVASVVAVAAHAKEIETVWTVGADVPLRLIGDPDRLQQIVLNLASNAVKFTSEGEVLVTAELLRRTDTSAEVRIRVSDTGIGIAPDVQSRLFLPFNQADPSTTRRFGGTGLGLAVSKKLTELMGGRIGLDSQPGQGSTFWCDLRFAIPPAQPVAERHPEFNFRILIADDNQRARQALREQLASLGLEVDAVADSESAMIALGAAQSQNTAYGAAVLDFSLASRNGMSLDVAIRSQPETRELPLILLRPQFERLQPLEQAWLDRSVPLRKPIRRTKLVESLRMVSRMTGTDPALSNCAPTVEVENSVPLGVAFGRILLVEDNLVNQKVAMKMLERLGYEADVAANGAEALLALEQQRYRAVLMDCQMPVMDGFEATREIRRRGNGIASTVVIAMTANAFTEDREKCREAGMDDYLAKPVGLDHLAAALSRWAERAPGMAHQ